MNKEEYNTAYLLLNDKQKQAVDTTEGVVIVIAGPGSGKTQLLSLRTAHILKSQDVEPHSILCLTYTDAAAHNMRTRIAKFTSTKIANQIHISTFHAFAKTILDNSSLVEYTPISELEKNKLIVTCIEGLPPLHPLKTKHPKLGWIYQRTLLDRISDIKKSGLTPNQFLSLHQEISDWCSSTEHYLQTMYELHTKNAITYAKDLLKALSEQPYNTQFEQYSTLQEAAITELAQAIQQSSILAPKSQATRIRNWCKTWLEKSKDKYVWKYTHKAEQYSGLAHIYSEYTKKMETGAWIDYDDMILQAKEQLMHNPEIRSSYQEKYSYILVDEFQDNTMAQNEILYTLGSHTVHEGNPNILVVGDDDQSIYKFGGANVSCIGDFLAHYPKSTIIQLDTNYRSSSSIIQLANDCIATLQTRFIADKTIHPSESSPKNIAPVYNFYETQTDQYTSISKQVQEWIQQGVSPSEIAIIARKHKSISRILPIIQHYTIPIKYTKTLSLENIQPIQAILLIARYLVLNTDFSHPEESHLPSILSHPAFDIPAQDIWDISRYARENKVRWVESSKQLNKQKAYTLLEWLDELIKQKHTQSAQEMIATILGDEEVKLEDKVYTSPLKEHFFGKKATETQAYLIYIQALSHLYALAEKTSGYTTIDDYVRVWDEHSEYHVNMNESITLDTQQDAVQLLTAHQSKGLEFSHVCIIDATEQEWFPIKRSANKLPWPKHLDLSPQPDDREDITRIAYVAMTRAKHNLILSGSKTDTQGKLQEPWHILEDILPTQYQAKQKHTLEEQAQLIKSALLPETTMFTPVEKHWIIEKAQALVLSSTSILQFVDLEHGGPKAFIEKNIFRYPEAQNPNTLFGSFIHKQMDEAMKGLQEHNILPELSKILENAQQELATLPLRKTELDTYAERTNRILSKAYHSIMQEWRPTDRSEIRIPKSTLVQEKILMSGAVDRLYEREHTMHISDYKTGKALSKQTSKSRDWTMFKYKFQFYTYILLLLQNKQITNEQIHQGIQGEFIFLDTLVSQDKPEIYSIPFDPEEYEKMQELISIVHKIIIEGEYPDIDQFKEGEQFTPQSNLTFVDWLLKR